MQTKKGFILIYTILVGLICLIIMMYIFDIQVLEMKYSTSTKRYVLKEDNYQKYKEYLMTLFFKYTDMNNKKIKEVGINTFFNNLENDIVKYGEGKVIYSNTTNEFIFKTPDEYRLTRNDYYKLELVGESFQMIFVKTDYTYSI